MPRRIAILLLVLSTACSKAYLNLCPNLEVASEQAQEHEDRELKPEAGLTGLVPTIDTGTFAPPEEIRDCRAQRIESPTNACSDQTATTERLEQYKLSGDDLVITDREGDDFLVWAQAHHFIDGDALGPVAVAQWFRRGIRVSAIGPLRGPAKHARLRLENLSDGHVLVVEGDSCPQGRQHCTRVVRVVPLVEGTFVDKPMRLLNEPGCGGPATFPLSASQDVVLTPGKFRRFRIQRNLVIKDGFGIVHEEAVATDHDEGQPNAEGVEFRRYSKARELMLDKDGLLVQSGIWEQLLAGSGSIRPSDHTPPPPSAG